ncbi:disease resistance protein At4g27190-like [Rosa rugosa]|uniref:disease resistance protein At4g27190-like n=1 Tax=Rosa rugosa TaxID=74645 RepID=UPI002B4008D3|nr:disease resistance protein At4g27190-like [Rosa rugosa]XP_061993105.1 disease resistance protein At4g27190-like [Rosa rugosa]
MAFLIDIGTGIVGKIVELTVAPIGRQVGYLIYCNDNVKKLKKQLKNLVDASQSVEHKVSEEKRNIGEVEAEVNTWLTDVQKITEEANEILKEGHKEKMKCLYGLCPNLVLRHQLSRKSTKLVHDIAELYGKRDFNTFAHATTPHDVPTTDYEAFASRTLVVNQIMDVLRKRPDINMIGVYGLGGVGKTTLVKEIYRQATGDKTLFDDVAMILDVKQNPSIERIQKEIAEKLGLGLPESETTIGRARRLFSRIKDQKTLVILDDVCKKINLEDVGLSGVATCKVLLTSRMQKVLSSEMHTQKVFPLDLLGEEEAWNLFEKKAGDVVKHPAIKKKATKVAKKCGGLPVLVVTVASALKNRSTLHAWKDALRRLKRFDNEEFTEKTYLALEWSYGQLNDEELKPLFLLCGINANSSKTIPIDYLFKYGIGLGMFKNLNTMGEAWDALNSLLEKLKDSCLLLDHAKSGYVKMHDLVHDVAKRILLKDQNVLREDGNELKEWPDNKDFCEKCTKICLQTSNIPKLPEVLQCKELKLFYLNTTDDVLDYSLEIPCNFFQETTKLRVLDLTGLSIPSLPPSLQFLKCLKTLCLDWCTLGDIALIGQLQNLEMLSFQGSKFKELPKEIGHLTGLRSLDLTHCSQLELISPNVISSLKRLEELKMGNSFNRWEAKGAISIEKNNASLSELKKLSRLSALEIHILDANILPTGLFSKALKRYRIYVGDVWNWNDEDTNLNTLKIKLTTGNELYQSGVNILLKRTDELHLNGMEAGNNTAYQSYFDGFQQMKHLHVHNAEFRDIITGEGVFPNLTRLVVSDLHGLKCLLSSSMARSLVQLTHLEVSRCQTMEKIVSTDESDEKHMNDMFSKLQHLELKDLPILTRLCSRFPYLEISQPKNYNEIEEMDSRENLGNAFFDKKVVFPSLKRLFINGLTKLMTLWHSQLSPESFKNLETVDIRSCQSLKSVFPSSMVKRLQQLTHLNVVNCRVEEILENEDGLPITHEFVFSKVNSLGFEDLPHLRSGMHASRWPSLEALRVLSCCKVAFLAQECSSFERNCELMNPTPTNNQALFLMKKDSFPNLKLVSMRDMEIWDGPFPVKFFSKLEILQVGNQHCESAAVLEKFLDLDKPSVTSSAHSNEISFHEKSRSGDINAVGALPQLSTLWFYGMEKLMHLGEDNTQSAGRNFPNLKALVVQECHSLRNLRSSAISFKNLTNLEVYGCPGLEYLINYSTAKSFTQLTVLAVKDCAKIVEIVGSTEDDDSGNEIVFSCLEYLELSNLPRLRGFCSRDCIVKFPSLETSSISKRLKLKIFHNDEMVRVTNEEVDTDVDADDDEAVTKEKVDIETGVGGEQIDVATKIANKDIDTGVGGEQIDVATKIANKNEDANVDGSEHVQPVETTATDQGVKTPVEENLAIIPAGEVTTPVFPVIESAPVAEVPHTEEVREQNLEPLAEEAKPDVHQTPNAREQPVEEQSDPLEPSAAATGTPTPTIPALPPPSSPKSSETKRSLREKLQALSAKKAASSSGLSEEARAKLKALIATADLKDPHTRQQLLAVLPTLQLSTTKWIAELAVQELSKLPLVLDKEESLCQELAALKAQGSKLDVRSHILLSEGPLAEENIQKVQEQKVVLLALEEQIKKLEVRATSIRAEITLGEKRYSGFEASLDQLVKEQQLNQLSVDSTSQELLRTRAVSDSLSTAIFTYLRQLL